MRPGQVLDWIFLAAMGGLTAFALVAGVLWTYELIPPVDLTPSQVFGFALILAAWVITQVILDFRGKSREAPEVLDE